MVKKISKWSLLRKAKDMAKKDIKKNYMRFARKKNPPAVFYCIDRAHPFSQNENKPACQRRRKKLISIFKTCRHLRAINHAIYFVTGHDRPNTDGRCRLLSENAQLKTHTNVIF